MPAQWPGAAEVGDIMVSSGLATAAPSEAELEPYINAAIADWHKRTGYLPWLEGASASYYYDGPEMGPVLQLNCGFTAISAVAVFITATDSTGTVLTALEDYLLEPIGAREDDRPFTQIRFLSSLSRGPRSIKVTGTKGYDDTIADDVWLAVARQAARLAVEDLSENGGDVDRIKQGQVEIEYSKESGSVLAKWDMNFSNLAMRYRRMVV